MRFFEKYLTLWVALCIAAGIAVGQLLMLVRIANNTRHWFDNER